ncbi:hypothetical protein Nepgr_028998 [Nepenthes gracilis]|uniref:Uncharacterized protein n=1 Tax=Nepenthes gracilis TaxID=150966 RepID=A0AAD3TBK8_NEPGR|nr:hypothetical protein Nepgr_028998 [Nepenthes gracilis]
MGFSKESKSKRIIRAIKTIFFLITLLISFLLFSAPVLLAVADSLLPSALLSASHSPTFLSPQTLSSYLANYDFRSSLIDIPLISVIRSIVIICVYSCCDGPTLSRGPYLLVATLCSLLSSVFVSLKASVVFWGNITAGVGGGGGVAGEHHLKGVEVALFVCSYSLAVGHVVVAYRTSCRERKKLLVYKIDIEAISAWKNGSELIPTVKGNAWLLSNSKWQAEFAEAHLPSHKEDRADLSTPWTTMAIHFTPYKSSTHHFNPGWMARMPRLDHPRSMQAFF